MAFSMALYSTIVFSILLFIPIAESTRCARNFTFEGWHLNWSIPFNLYRPSNDSNNNTNEDCRVHLAIDFTTGLVNGWFNPRNQSSRPQNQLDVLTIFSLKGTSKNVSITYTCSMSDYCDIDFLREALSSVWPTLRIESIRQELISRLYNANNTGPVSCSAINSCPQNISYCSVAYSRINGTSGGTENIGNGCDNGADHEPILLWLQNYTPLNRDSLIEIGVFDCNIPNCASNNTVIETFRWLTREYVLPLNISKLHFTSPTPSPVTTTTTTSTGGSTTTTTSTRGSATTTSTGGSTTTTSTGGSTTTTTSTGGSTTTTISTGGSTTTTSTRGSTTRTSTRRLSTPRNDASNLFGQLNIVILCFIAILFFH